jgi:hypothetical protein
MTSSGLAEELEPLMMAVTAAASKELYLEIYSRHIGGRNTHILTC